VKFARALLGGTPRLCLVDEAAGTLHPLAPGITELQQVIAAPTLLPGAPVPLSGVTLLAPILPPRNIFCVGKNYREHAREFSASGFEAGASKDKPVDDYPAIFTKPASSVVGQNAVVDLHPTVANAVDYEAELAVIIGKPGRNITPADAMAHVWGYTIINDVTARDRQKNHKQWFMGKALDTLCPMRPWAVTADAVDGTALDIACLVNGEMRQSANTRDLIFTIPQLIATLSAGLALQPGDVISTGTPAGVGIGFDPPRFLKSGDQVLVTIAGIGTLRNSFT
jgi:2-keto-4-pentenoate hydratase/2-oxohepta-3-ene-1,7-dioic acid hydratase in catechol pathway